MGGNANGEKEGNRRMRLRGTANNGSQEATRSRKPVGLGKRGQETKTLAIPTFREGALIRITRAPKRDGYFQCTIDHQWDGVRWRVSSPGGLEIRNRRNGKRSVHNAGKSGRSSHWGKRGKQNERGRRKGDHCSWKRAASNSSGCK